MAGDPRENPRRPPLGTETVPSQDLNPKPFSSHRVFYWVELEQRHALAAQSVLLNNYTLVIRNTFFFASLNKSRMI